MAATVSLSRDVFRYCHGEFVYQVRQDASKTASQFVPREARAQERIPQAQTTYTSSISLVYACEDPPTSVAPSTNESSLSGRFLISSTSFGPLTITSHWSNMAILNTEP